MNDIDYKRVVDQIIEMISDKMRETSEDLEDLKRQRDSISINSKEDLLVKWITSDNVEKLEHVLSTYDFILSEINSLMKRE